MQQQLRTSHDTSEETKKVHDPELPDEMVIQNSVMNYQMCKKRQIIVKKQMCLDTSPDAYDGIGQFTTLRFLEDGSRRSRSD